MEIGDLVKVPDCEEIVFGSLSGADCPCFFCHGNSNRIGIVKTVAPMNNYVVQFDCGEWRFDKFDLARGDVKVISKRDV